MTITVPSSGTIVITGSMYLLLYNTSGTANTFIGAIGDTHADCGVSTNRVYFEIPASWPTVSSIDRQYITRQAFNVSAVTYTDYITGYMLNGYVASTGRFWYASMDAVFIPD